MIYNTFPACEDVVSKESVRAAHDVFSHCPTVEQLRVAFKNVHEFYDALLDRGLLKTCTKFSSLVLNLHTGNAISEFGFSLMNYTL